MTTSTVGSETGAIHLTGDDVAELIEPETAIAAMREAFTAERRGLTQLPPRIDVNTRSGFLRTMPAVLDDVMGLKVMTLVKDLGTRYLVMVYDVDSGQLVAAIDADQLTKVRTAAVTALAAECMLPSMPERISIIGTGFEARGHAQLFAAIWPVREFIVFSRSDANRQAFREAVGTATGVTVTTVDTSVEALRASEVVLLATKSVNPVLDGMELLPGSTVLSIGSTRLDLRELDLASLARAHRLVVDHRQQVLAESADVRAALEGGAIAEDHIVALADLVDQPAEFVPDHEGKRTVQIFKSVGTALQDLALARALLDLARKEGLGRPLGNLAQLKPFTT